MVKHMKLVDLTHPITPNMPVYPGTQPPVFITGCSIDETGFLEKQITLYSHTGTHIDAPAHLIKDHNTLDMLEIEHFYGPALMLDFYNFKAKRLEFRNWNLIRTQSGRSNFCCCIPVGAGIGVPRDTLAIILCCPWRRRTG
jgi:kynurenine formamidase